MKALLWLDDLRNPFEENHKWVKKYLYNFNEYQIIWVKNYVDFCEYINENGLPNIIGFDHDLGSDISREKVKNGMSKRQFRREKRGTLTGYDCAKWLVEYCMDNKKDLPNWFIQSANPVGTENINKLLINFLKQ